jgi:hypothetical protein
LYAAVAMARSAIARAKTSRHRWAHWNDFFRRCIRHGDVRPNQPSLSTRALHATGSTELRFARRVDRAPPGA